MDRRTPNAHDLLTHLAGHVNVDIVPAPGVVQADITVALPFEDASFDVVTARQLPGQLTTNAKFASESFRVLQSGGTLDLHSNTGFGPLAEQNFQAAGFTDIKIKNNLLTARKN